MKRHMLTLALCLLAVYTTAQTAKNKIKSIDITIEGLSKEAGIVTAAVKKQLQQMINKGYIQRKEKDGSWYVFAI